MRASDSQQNAHFDIHASVVLQLGESLITDVPQSLVELVKNSYDADASYTKVLVDTKSKVGELSHYQDAVGYIIIEDDGIGMDEATIRRGWLTISNSPKREMKRLGLTTERGRTPLGDKGLGRLSSQRLADNVEIFTTPKGSDTEFHVAFSWNAFLRNDITLTEIPVLLEERFSQGKQGTRLIISGLRDLDEWNSSAIGTLESKLSQLISPYKEVENFTVAAIVDGKRLELAEYSEQIRKAASLSYRIDFDEVEFSIKGKAKLDYFKPDGEEEKQEYKLLLENDEGEQFFHFLAAKGQAERYQLRKSQEGNWYIEYTYKRLLANIDKLKLVDGKPANPGSFHGEIDYFRLVQDGSSSLNVFSGTSALKKFVKDIGGIRVYRDGFGIRVDNDWLSLGKQQTSSISFYGLRPGNTIGYIALTAKDNSKLEETTNRESFKATPYYDNFYLMLREFVKFSLDAQTFIRRSWNDFKRASAEKLPKPQITLPPEEISMKIKEGLSIAETHEASLTKTKGSLEEAVKEAQSIVEYAEQVFPPETMKTMSIQAQTKSFTQRVEQARKEVSLVETYLHDISDIREEAENLNAQISILRNQITLLKEQLSQAYETVSLGLTAEALSHEIAVITDKIAYRNRQTMDYLKSKGMKDLVLTGFTEYINVSITALRKQLSHLAPSLKYVRENKEKIILGDFFKEIESYYHDRFASTNMELRIVTVKEDNFVLLINKGKLNQIIDNILLNSEYWLREDMRLKRYARGIITIELSKPFVHVSDNGRGIDPSVEKSLFEPFVTTKGQGIGRGLGLFIVQQLLESENCTISVQPTRNKYNHLYIFEIDFRGGLSDRS